MTDAAPSNPRRYIREERVAAILRFAGVEEPTGDIDQLLDEIERGRGLT